MTVDLPMIGSDSARTLRSRPAPACPQCGAEGVRLYAGLTDRLFSAPGQWNLNRCPSAECRTLWLDPMPVEEDLEEAYRSYYTHLAAGEAPRDLLRRAYRWFKEGYFALRYGYPVTPPAIVKRLLGATLLLAPDLRENLDLRVMALRFRPGGRLLDVGCGAGHALEFLRGLGWRVEGVDFDPSAVEQARGLGLEVRLGTLQDQRYPDRSFDAVIMNHLIEHVPAPGELLRECRRILREDGQLTVVTPNASSWGHSVFRERWRGLEPPRHLQIFTTSSLRVALARAGFRRVRVRTCARLAGMICRESRAPERVARGGVPPGVTDAWFLAAAHARMLFASGGGEEVVATAGP